MASVSFIIKSISALRKACEKRGLKLVKKSEYRWFGSWVNDYHSTDAAYRRYDPKDFGKNAEYVITIPGDDEAYEIGVVKRPDGKGYDLLMDFWGAEGQKIALAAGGRRVKGGWSLHEGLIQDYSIEASRETETVQTLLNEHGCQETMFNDENGDIVLVYEN